MKSHLFEVQALCLSSNTCVHVCVCVFMCVHEQACIHLSVPVHEQCVCVYEVLLLSLPFLCQAHTPKNSMQGGNRLMRKPDLFEVSGS